MASLGWTGSNTILDLNFIYLLKNSLIRGKKVQPLRFLRQKCYLIKCFLFHKQRNEPLAKLNETKRKSLVEMISLTQERLKKIIKKFQIFVSFYNAVSSFLHLPTNSRELPIGLRVLPAVLEINKAMHGIARSSSCSNSSRPYMIEQNCTIQRWRAKFVPGCDTFKGFLM